MRRIAPLLLITLLLAAALPAAAQTPPRRPPADTLRFGATRPAAGDSIRMAEYAEAEDAGAEAADPEDEEDASASGQAEEDTVPGRPKPGPYARASGGSGPFTVQASGQTAERPPRGDVVWLEGRAARPAAADSARRDTARAGSGGRVAAGQGARRDTAASSRPARDTTGARGNGGAAAGQTAGRQGQSAATNPPNRPGSGGSTGRTSSTPTASGSNGRTSSTPPTTSGGNGRTSSTTTTSGGGRTGSNGSASSSSSSSRARAHTVASGETFYGIARRYGVTAAQLRAVNPDVVMDSLEVGDELRLPASARDSRAGSGGGSTSSAQRPSGQTQARTQGGSQQGQRRTHTVAAGETLYGIARRYGVTVDAIREANDMEGDQVRTGQRLVIPPAR